jgi:phage baseplate assembly protein W
VSAFTDSIIEADGETFDSTELAGMDWNAVGKKEVLHNIMAILTTEIGTVPLDRNFGLDDSIIDLPINLAIPFLRQEIFLKIRRYEPRAQINSIEFVGDPVQGNLKPILSVSIAN